LAAPSGGGRSVNSPVCVLAAPSGGGRSVNSPVYVLAAVFDLETIN
jgi:hypothetical protein